jgi:hypothetical protein
MTNPNMQEELFSIAQKIINNTELEYELEVRFGEFHKSFNSNIGLKTFRKVLEQYNGKFSVNHYYELDVSKDSKRLQIIGLENIRKWCNTDDLEENQYEIYNKTRLNNYDIKKYNIRCSFSHEKLLNKDEIVKFQNKDMKNFRYKERWSIKIPENFFNKEKDNNLELFKIDFTIVKQENGKKFSDSNVLEKSPVYEIEIEYIGKDNINNNQLIIKYLFLLVKNVLQVIQNSDNIISVNENEKIKSNYKKLTHQDTKIEFIGKNPITLGLIHINELRFKNGMDYVVTDKADGERILLFKSDNNNAYFIDRNREFHNMGTIDDIPNNTIIDGEYLVEDRIYLAFDVLFWNGESYIPVNKNDKTGKNLEDRLYNIKDKNFVIVSPFGTYKNIYIATKKYIGFNEILNEENLDDKNIFKWSAEFWKNKDINGDVRNTIEINGKNISYELDGLIYTPRGLYPPIHSRATWNEEYKWKPPHLNTIDALIKFKFKNNSNEIDKKHLISDGNYINYRIIYIYIGKRINGNYEPAPFYPIRGSQIENSNAHIAEIQVNKDGNVVGKLDNRIVRNNTIVELSYNKNEPKWKWSVLRTRIDKTEAYENGFKQYGNDEKVANSIWESIHEEINYQMITGEIDIQDAKEFYGIKSLRGDKRVALQHFHNLEIKNKLIKKSIKKGNKVLDFACGKGGDLFRFNETYPSLYIGIDVDFNGILKAQHLLESPKIQNKENYKFLCGNLKETIYLKNKDINIEFGKVNKCDNSLEIQNYFHKKMYEFDVVSCQQAIPFMCESKNTFKLFILNIIDNLKIGGYFIATFFDGQKVYNLLDDISKEKSYKKENDKINWTLTKLYKSNSSLFKKFNDDSIKIDNNVIKNSFGKKINVSSSFWGNRFHTEYLVNFNVINVLFNIAKLQLISDEEANEIFGLSSSTNTFDKLYENYIKDNDKRKKMTDEEKEFSFLNRYVIYKKIDNLENKIRNKFFS